jgi:hypothetical protein
MLHWLLALLLLVSAAWAVKDYVAPDTQEASAYPARDEHPQEQVVVAADPYDTKEKARIFNLPYDERGILPIYLVIINERGQPVSLTNMKVQLVTSRKDKISSSGEDDLYRRFAEIKRRPDLPSRVPLPIPRRAPRGSIPAAGIDELKRAPFQARAVEPGASQAGFLFFDVSGIPEPLAGAHLYVTGVRDAAGKELMFFDISMDKYLEDHSSGSK